MPSPHFLLGRKLANFFTELPQVEAVCLAGSQRSGSTDSASDIDVYIYTCAEIPLEIRRQIVERSGGATRANLGLEYWGPGDEWYDAASGIEVDLVYFDATWMAGQLQQVLVEHRASAGYTTCLWYTLLNSQILIDPRGWFARLKAFFQQPYPDPLRRNIITYNHPLLRGVIPAYAHQLEKAVQRRDWVSVNHRLAALLASYFDILFALNRLPHPGEKRLLAFAVANCKTQPVGMAEDVTLLLSTAADPACLAHLNRLLDRLDDLLQQHGFDVHSM